MNPLAAVSSRKDALGLFALVAVRRIGDAGFPVAVLLAVTVSRSITEAAIILAVRTAAATLSAPFRARLLDRFGLRRLVPLQTTITSLALIMLTIALLWTSSPVLLIFALAIVQAVSSPSVDAVIRTHWRVLSRNKDELKAFHAADSVIEEVAFFLGPVAVSGCVLAFGSRWTLVIFSVALIIGAVSIYLPASLRTALMSEKTNDREGPTRTGARSAAGRLRTLAGPILSAPLRRIVSPLILMGVALGTVGVLIPAVGAKEGHESFSGFFFGIISLGGLVGGLVFGAIKVRSSPWVQHAFFSLLLGTPLLVGVLATGPVRLASMLLVMGLAVTPIYINSYLLLDKEGDKQFAHENNTWVSVGNNAGYTVGLLVAGLLLRAGGITAVATMCSVVGVVVVTAALALYRRTKVNPGSGVRDRKLLSDGRRSDA